MNKPRIFLGNVMHRRLRPAVNAFVYPVFYIQLSVRHPELANCPIFSVDRSNLLSFRTKDHGARDGSPLLPWIQAQLRQRGLPDDGEITLQCFPRVFGYVFNPVSFWFCRNIEGALIAVLAEVNNTFGGRHSYLLHNADGSPLRDGQEICASKEFHVSPFNEIEGGYRFRFHLDRPLPLARIDYDDAEGELLRLVYRRLAWRFPENAFSHRRRDVPHPLASRETLAERGAIPWRPRLSTHRAYSQQAVGLRLPGRDGRQGTRRWEWFLHSRAE